MQTGKKYPMPMNTYNDNTSSRVSGLLLRHRKLVWWLCLRRAKGDRERGRDLMQEVVIALWRHAGRLRTDASAAEERRWVRRLTLTALGNISRRGSIVTVPLRSDYAYRDVDAEQRELIDELAAHLSDDDRRLLDLRLKGYSNNEIAAITGLEPGNVAQHMHRIVGRLRNIYERLYCNV